MTFNTFSTFDPFKSLISQRLYVYETDKETFKMTAFTKNGYPSEQKGLGFTQYFAFVGPILKLLGFALKTKNERGEVIYVNKSSFSHYILRLKAAVEVSKRSLRDGVVTNTTYCINVKKVNDLYFDRKVSRQQIKDQNSRLESHWDSTKNIQQLIHDFLKV